MANTHKGIAPTGSQWEHIHTINYGKQEWLFFFNHETSDVKWRQYKLISRKRVRGYANYFLSHSQIENRFCRNKTHQQLNEKRPGVYAELVNFMESQEYNPQNGVKYCEPSDRQIGQYAKYKDWRLLDCGKVCSYLMQEDPSVDGWISVHLSISNGDKRIVNETISYNVYQMRFARQASVEKLIDSHPELFNAVNARIESQIGHKTITEQDRKVIKRFDLGAMYVELSYMSKGDWASYLVTVKSGDDEKTFCCARNVLNGELSQAKVSGLQALQNFNDVVYYQVNKTILGIE